MEEEEKEAIVAIASGALASKLKKNMSYTTTGAFIGLGVGILFSIVAGKSRMTSALIGIAAGAAGGRVVAGLKKTEVETTKSAEAV